MEPANSIPPYRTPARAQEAGRVDALTLTSGTIPVEDYNHRTITHILIAATPVAVLGALGQGTAALLSSIVTFMAVFAWRSRRERAQKSALLCISQASIYWLDDGTLMKSAK